MLKQQLNTKLKILSKWVLLYSKSLSITCSLIFPWMNNVHHFNLYVKAKLFLWVHFQAPWLSFIYRFDCIINTVVYCHVEGNWQLLLLFVFCIVQQGDIRIMSAMIIIYVSNIIIRHDGYSKHNLRRVEL